MVKKVLVEDQIAANKRNTVFICIFMLLFLFSMFFVFGLLFGVPPIFSFIIGSIVSSVYLLITYSFSVSSILIATKARPINLSNREEKLLDYKIEELAIASGLPKPKVYVQDTEDINAFATGKKYEDSIVCVTRGALKTLNQEELEGVLAHELSHIKNKDILLATVIIGVVGTIAILSEIVLRCFIWGSVRGRDRDNNWVIVVIGIVFEIIAIIFDKLSYVEI